MTYFKLWPSVIPVEGKQACAVYDLDRHAVHPLTRMAFRAINVLCTTPRETLMQALGNQAHRGILRQMNRLVEMGWGFITSTPLRFPPLPLQWHCSGHIQQAVIEYGCRAYDIGAVIAQLDRLLCQHLTVILLPGASLLEEARNVLRLTEDRCFRSVSLVMGYVDSPSGWERWFAPASKLARLTLYSAPFPKRCRMGRTEELVLTPLDLGGLQARSFRARLVVNRPFFFEAHRFNPYFNGRVCVDRWGNLKNCLSHRASFGMVQQRRLETLLGDRAFTTLWHAAPDRVIGLRDHPLRYALLSGATLRRLPSGVFLPTGMAADTDGELG